MQLAIREGRFREDLYHRLNEFEIRQPSLAECPEDILPLAEFFRERHSKELKRETQGFTDDARRRMLAYHWPGNVRELQNRIKRAVLVTETPMLNMEALDMEIRPSVNDDAPSRAVLPLRDESMEKESIIKCSEGLQRTPGTSRGDAEYQSGNAVPENEEIRAEVK